ncbi:hypothetical protein TruAng_011944 [Truncatella angustata]|nr:hypothetical protein TruAng_011944 [Truncatella angustata]
MHVSTLISLFANAAAISAAAVQVGQTTGGQDYLARIKGWKNMSNCSGSDLDLDFYITEASVNECVPLPFATTTAELGALKDGSYQVSFYTDGDCTDLVRGTTVNVSGNCLNSNIGAWNSVKVTTYDA